MASKCNIDIVPKAPVESLWALAADGMLWQINPLSCSAAPVLFLDELPQRERRKLQHHMLLRWSRPLILLQENVREPVLATASRTERAIQQ